MAGKQLAYYRTLSTTTTTPKHHVMPQRRAAVHHSLPSRAHRDHGTTTPSPPPHGGEHRGAKRVLQAKRCSHGANGGCAYVAHEAVGPIAETIRTMGSGELFGAEAGTAPRGGGGGGPHGTVHGCRRVSRRYVCAPWRVGPNDGGISVVFCALLGGTRVELSGC